MPIQTHWNEDRTLLHVDFVGRWTWADFDGMMADGERNLRENLQTYDIIINALQSNHFPAGLPQGMRAMRLYRAGAHIVFVTDNKFNRALLELLCRVYHPKDVTMTVVGSVDEALTWLAAQRPIPATV